MIKRIISTAAFMIISGVFVLFGINKYKNPNKQRAQGELFL